MQIDGYLESIDIDDVIGLLNNKQVDKVKRVDNHEFNLTQTHSDKHSVDIKSRKANSQVKKNKMPQIYDKYDRFRFSGQLNPINRQKQRVQNINNTIQEMKQ